MNLLRFITCGSVDDGKSTLIGRLLWESKLLFDDQLASLEKDSKKFGTQGDDIDFALLVDGLSAEREQGITIDVAYRFFTTDKRKFIVADTPGHEQYTRNMVTGASTAEVAILLVDSRYGIQTQTCRHAFLVSLLGIKHVCLAINKMDIVNYNEEIFRKITADFSTFASTLDFASITSIPLSALKGDNITHRSGKTPWYQGPTLIGFLETIEPRQEDEKQLIFPIQLVNRPNSDFRGFSGSVSEGEVKVGDEIRVTGSGQKAVVARIVTMDGDLALAKRGSAVTLVLNKEIDASRGDVVTLAKAPIESSDQFDATIVWMGDEKGLIGRSYDIKLSSQWARASITSLKYKINVNTLAHESAKDIEMNDIILCNISISKALAFTTYVHAKELGSFILVDRYTNKTIAAGMINHSLRRAQNIHTQALSITRLDREELNGHRGKVIWFTGLSGSGKSSIANALEVALHNKGKKTYILDGDNIRQGLNKDLGFTDSDRVENIRRVAEVAKLMMDAGLIVMTSFISPFKQEREMARDLIGAENFIEVFVNTPIEVCEARDVKGLYKKARSGQLPNLSGLGSSYENPAKPDVMINTVNTSISEAVSIILKTF